MAAGQNLELTGLQFEDHGACYPRFFARGGPKFFYKPSDHGFGFRQWHVVLKSIFDRDRLGRPVRHDFAVVDTAGEVVQAQSIAAELTFEHWQIQPSQVLYSLYAKGR